MKAKIQYNNREFQIDLAKPIDLSIEMNSESVQAWYQDHLKIEPVVDGDFIGEVKSGAPVNFRNIFFNPHAHGTHTECYGHISKEWVSVSNCITDYFHLSKVITVTPDELDNGDFVITKDHIIGRLGINELNVTALIIRTTPNSLEKKSCNYSNTNPPYILADAMQYIVEQKINHLLVDLPSVDKENDDGKLLSHRVFWNYPNSPRKSASITEMIYVPNDVRDDVYFVQLQFPKFNNDASPSRIFIYSIN